MESYLKWVEKIDQLSDWSGRIVSYLVYPLVGGVAYEVIARYFFNAPTEWAYDVTYMLYGAIFMLGAAYTLLKKGHIRTDLLLQQMVATKAGKNRRHHVPGSLLSRHDLLFDCGNRLCGPFLDHA